MFDDDKNGNPGKTDSDKRAEQHENHDPNVLTTSSQEDQEEKDDE